MADEKKKKTKKPKLRQCAQTKKNLKRKTWYYRDGEYFQNKSAFKEWKKKQEEAKQKASEEQAAKSA